MKLGLGLGLSQDGSEGGIPYFPGLVFSNPRNSGYVAVISFF